MASYNRIIMIGNLTRDPEYRQLPSGQAVCRFSLASNRSFKNKQTGTMVQEVCFIDVDVWGPQAESCNQYLQKGRSALIEGRLKFDSWQDTDGNRKSKHSIVADRVTFLASGGQVTDEDGVISSEGDISSMQSFTPSVSPKPVKKPRASTSSVESSGELDYKDEAPFEDDLPF
jgi:single-strand DNA-binding protein